MDDEETLAVMVEDEIQGTASAPVPPETLIRGELESKPKIPPPATVTQMPPVLGELEIVKVVARAAS